MKRLLQSYLPFPVIHLYKTYKYNLSTVVERQPSSLLQNLVTTTNKLISNRKKILFYPDFPSLSSVIYQICLFLGYDITNSPEETFAVCIKWKDATFSRSDHILSRLSAQNVSIININCEDISKSSVDKVFHTVFGYSVSVNPLTYTGKCVVKSNLNYQHDGKIISCPISTIKSGVVYNKLIDNEVEGCMVLDYRVPVFKHVIPFVYLKQRSLEDRFGGGLNNLISVRLASVHNVFSEEEIRKILCFSQKIGLEYGELDVLRDRTDKRLYIVDANNTPSCNLLFDPLKLPPDKRFLSPNDRLIALQKLAQSFKEALSS